MQALDALLNRVSVPRLLEPAPTAEQREVLFAAAMRAPDHGQLRPWRFLTVEGAAREQARSYRVGGTPLNPGVLRTDANLFQIKPNANPSYFNSPSLINFAPSILLAELDA